MEIKRMEERKNEREKRKVNEIKQKKTYDEQRTLILHFS